MAYAQAAQRPIPGAVATLGVSDRVTFLRKTYAHLGGALIAFAALTWFLMTHMTEMSIKWTMWTGQGMSWLIVLGLFMAVNIGAQRLAMHETSRGLQYVGLGMIVVAWSFLMQPILWFIIAKFHGSSNTSPTAIITQSAIITLAIFIGLTLTVFVSKKDFSFLRGILSICTFAALGTIVASLLFGFTLGAFFSGLIILLMAGYILHQTSLILSYFPPTAHVAAALMLFGTIATLFMHVLNVMGMMRDR
jgi:FtsH-binding integral membrane protein